MGNKTLEKAIKTIKLSNDPEVLQSLLNLKLGETGNLLKKKFNKIRKDAKGGLIKKRYGGSVKKKTKKKT